jgi:hypothetical protein
MLTAHLRLSAALHDHSAHGLALRRLLGTIHMGANGRRRILRALARLGTFGELRSGLEASLLERLPADLHHFRLAHRPHVNIALTEVYHNRQAWLADDHEATWPVDEGTVVDATSFAAAMALFLTSVQRTLHDACANPALADDDASVALALVERQVAQAREAVHTIMTTLSIKDCRDKQCSKRAADDEAAHLP